MSYQPKKNAVMEMNNSFHTRLFKELFDQERDSFVFSPYSINFIMMMAYQGMDGQTKKEFEEVYGLPRDNQRLVEELMAFDRRIQHDQLKSANAQFVERSYQSFIKEEFMRRTYLTFDFCDFRNYSEAERERINEWVALNTKKMITEICSKGTIRPLTCMVLVNAIYLKMKWTYAFSNSVRRDFTKMDNTMERVNMMKMWEEKDLAYYEDDVIQMVLLPYRSTLTDTGSFSMGFILPKEKGSFEPVLNVVNYVNQVKTESVDVKIPKFEIEYNVNLSELYKKLGLKTAFQEGKCNFGKMTEVNDLYITKIIHKTKIIVDEKGTEAAAATSICIFNMLDSSFDVQGPKYFTADHTFQYFIMHDQTKTILFSGVFNGT
tara:strand:+ start:240 stop:1367 length:1128 start_codon:yes stop_codon:yes gene_type:complete